MNKIELCLDDLELVSGGKLKTAEGLECYKVDKDFAYFKGTVNGKECELRYIMKTPEQEKEFSRLLEHKQYYILDYKAKDKLGL